MLLRLDEEAIAHLGAHLEGGSVLISATNGKTTTAAMLAGALERDGRRVVHNRAGSNMGWGVATALLDAGEEPEQLGLFEVDEAWLEPAVAAELDPRAMILGNLFRDQLDRYGELEAIADRWAELVAERDGRSALVLCADDPLVADLGRERQRVTYFGVEDDSLALPELQHAADSKHCRRCGHAYVYEAIYMGHLGRYRCPNCGRERPAPAVAAERIVLRGMSGSDLSVRTPAGRVDIRLPLPGLYNVYNALAATTAALELGVPLERVRDGLRGHVRRLRTRGDDSGRGPRRLDPAGQEPGGRERGPAHADARGRLAGPGLRSTTGSPTGATCPGSGTPTSSCWSAGRGA